jgi:hypothetical protein
MHRRSIATLTLLFVTAAVLPRDAATARGLQLAAERDGWIGTWNLNTAKSQFETGPLPRESTVVFEEVPGGVRVTNVWTNASGVGGRTEFTAQYDGRPAAVQGMKDTAMIFRRIDSRSFELIQQSAGFSINTHHVVLADARTITSTQVITFDDGEKLTNNSVFDRQR